MSLDDRLLEGGGVLGNHRIRRQPAAQPSRWTRAHSTSGHTFPFGNSAGPAKKAEAPPVGLAKKRHSERGGRAWTGAFTFPSCPLFCSRSKKRIFPRSKLVPSAIKGVRLRAPAHERRRPWGVRMASLGLPKGRRRDQGSAPRTPCWLRGTELMCTQSSVSGVRLPARSAVKPPDAHPTTPGHSAQGRK